MNKILMLVTDCFGGYGGIARYNQDFVMALENISAVDRVVILPRIAPDPFVPPSGKVVQLPSAKARVRYAIDALIAAIRLRPNIIFCGHLYHGRLASGIARLFGARLVSQLHGVEGWTALSRGLLKPLVDSDLVLCVSEDTRKCLVDQEPRLAKNTTVVYNTVGSQYTVGDRQAARAALGVESALVLLSVGRLDERDGYKGHDRVIPLVAELAAQGRDVQYLIAGKGEDLARLRQLSAQHGVADRVRFLLDVPGEALPDLYRAADLFVLPSRGEGFGIVYIESMACGTPAMGINVGGAPEALCHGELGISVDSDQFEAAMIEAVAAVSGRSDADRQTLSKKVRDRFGNARFISNVESVLEPLLD